MKLWNKTTTTYIVIFWTKTGKSSKNKNLKKSSSVLNKVINNCKFRESVAGSSRLFGNLISEAKCNFSELINVPRWHFDRSTAFVTWLCPFPYYLPHCCFELRIIVVGLFVLINRNATKGITFQVVRNAEIIITEYSLFF